MPLRTEEPLEGRRGTLPQPAPEPERPGALDIGAAALRQNNLVGGLMDAWSGDPRPDRLQPGYDPFDDIHGYEAFAERFADSDSPEETAYIKQRITHELADRQVLHDAGGWGLAASVASGLTDPVTLLSMAVPVGGATRLATIGRLVGTQVAFDTASEVAFHGLQETRTVEDSVLNVGAGAVLSGIVGAAVASRLPRETFEGIRRSLGADLKAPVESTAGAAAVRATTAEQETIARGGEVLDASLGRISPGARLLRSPSVEARRIVQGLAETPERLQKNAQGIATPTAIETNLKRLIGDWYESVREGKQFYREYRARLRTQGPQQPKSYGLSGPGWDEIEPAVPLSKREFREAVAFAMRRNDQHAIPEVAKAAAARRARIFEPLKQRAIRLGLLKADQSVQFADSYLMRQYNIAKIRADQVAWLNTLREGFQRQGVDALEAGDLADQVTRNILGSETGTLDLHVMDHVVPKSGRLKERTLSLPDEQLEPWLVNDVDALSLAYLRTLGPEVEITERFGDHELREAMQKVSEEYAVRRERAILSKDNAGVAELTRLEKRDLADLAAVRDRLYGHYGAPKDPGSFFIRAARAVRQVNYTRLLGGQVLSALSDLASTLLRYGAPKMMASAMRLATHINALKMASRTARRMGIGLDLVLNTRGLAIGDVAEYSTFIEQRIARRVGDAFSILSLQSPWNTIMKSWASVMSQDDILRAAARRSAGKAVSKAMIERLASIGIDDAMLRRIGAQAAEFGESHGGLHFGRSDHWTDTAAQRAFEGAVIKEADLAVLTPGSAGDLPRVHSTEWGKTILQFKSFAMASTRRLQVPLAQGIAAGEARAMYAVPVAFGLGALVYVLKQKTANQPITDDPAKFALEVVDKSGLMAWGSELVFPALWAFGADDYSRWSDRKAIETALGPTVGTLGGLWEDRWPDRLRDGDLNQTDIHRLRRLLPGQNLFWARRAINRLEEDAAE